MLSEFRVATGGNAPYAYYIQPLIPNTFKPNSFLAQPDINFLPYYGVFIDQTYHFRKPSTYIVPLDSNTLTVAQIKNMQLT